MNCHLLGRSGLRVSELCLGTMTFGTEWGWGTDKAESRNIFDAYVNFPASDNIRELVYGSAYGRIVP